jgi:hypothetical protein
LAWSLFTEERREHQDLALGCQERDIEECEEARRRGYGDLWCSGHSYEDFPWCTMDGVHAEYKAKLRAVIA